MPRSAARSSALFVFALAFAVVAAPLAAAPPEERAFAGGAAATLRGLPVSAATTTNLGFVNLAPVANRCSLSIAGPDGASLLPATRWTLRAFEERPLLDVFEGLAAVSEGGEATATVSCTGAFSAFAVLADRNGDTLRTVAAEKASPALAAGALAPLAGKSVECSSGALCFDAEGLVHVPSIENPVGRVAFPAPAGNARRFRVSMDVTVGDWFPAEPDGKHLVYWFVIDKNFDMPGLLYFRGPNKNEVFARHGVGLSHARKIKVIKKFAVQTGRTYHVEQDYDMAGRRFRVTLSDPETGAVLVTLSSRPNVTAYLVKAGAKFLVDMGFPPDTLDTEVPSYGWQFSNVHVEAFVR